MKKILSAILIAFTMVACGNTETLSNKTYVLQNSEHEITLGFDTNEQRYFGGAVNRFFGKYEMDGNKLTLLPGGSTMMMGPPSAMTAEQEFFAILPLIESYEISGDTLILKTKDGSKLEFVEVKE